MNTAFFLAGLGGTNSSCEGAQQQRSYVLPKAFSLEKYAKRPRFCAVTAQKNRIGGCGVWVGGITPQSRLGVFVISHGLAFVALVRSRAVRYRMLARYANATKACSLSLFRGLVLRLPKDTRCMFPTRFIWVKPGLRRNLSPSDTLRHAGFP